MDKRSMAAAVAVAALLLVGAPAGASAAGATPAVTAAADGVDYVPDKPEEPSLAGSWAEAQCLQSAPWISFSVTLTDPDGQSTGDSAALVISDGTHRVSLQLGTLTSGRLSGSVLWPGASVDAAGTGDGWPGWVYEQGEWLETSGNFAWTRGDISAWIRVNPELAVPLSYPDESAECAGPAGVAASLAATGGTTSIVAPLAGIAAAAVLGGVVLLVARRRRHS